MAPASIVETAPPPSAGTIDHAQVVGRPPLLYLAAICAAAMLRFFWHLPIVVGKQTPWPSMALFAIGALTIVFGRKALIASGTNVNPALPTTAIVKAGPYRYSRNPLYLSLTLIYIAIAMPLNSWWCVFMLLPLLAAMHFGVVLPEERYLQRKFGETYRQYRRTVRRYL